MMKFTQTGRTAGDETTPYIVTEWKSKNIREFVDEVLSNEREWGYIYVMTEKSWLSCPRCEYRYGKLLSKLNNGLLDFEIGKIDASGGWTRMDYFVYPKHINNTNTNKNINTMKISIEINEKELKKVEYCILSQMESEEAEEIMNEAISRCKSMDAIDISEMVNSDDEMKELRFGLALLAVGKIVNEVETERNDKKEE